MATSVKLDDELTDRIKQLAEARQRSPHWIMREAIREYVDRQEAQDAFKAEAMAAWRHYKKTGLHVTGDEVRDWLKTWGSDDPAAPPECHK